MTDNMYIYILSPLVTAIIAGVGYIGKRYVDAIEDRMREKMGYIC